MESEQKNSRLFLTHALVLSLLMPLNDLVADETEATGRKQPSLDCLVDPKSALRRMERGDLIIDVRRKEAFHRYRIRDSINVPLYEIKSKDFLKSKALLLVGEGVGNRAQLTACSELKAKGFKHVRVLHGDIASWHEAGGQVEGHWPTGVIPSMRPRELLQEFDPRLWAVIHVSNSPSSEIIEDAIKISYQKTEADLPKAVGRLDQEKRVGTLRPVIAIIADDVSRYPAIAQLLERTDAQVFYLEGGLIAYKRELRWQKEVRGKKTHVLSQPGNCK